MTTQHAVLLRGINVGGRHKVPMVDLRAVLEGAGYSDVRTYIQSGNVVLGAPAAATDPDALEAHLEEVLLKRFGFPIPVVSRPAAEYRTVVSAAPPGFGAEPDLYHYDVLFLKRALPVAEAFRVMRRKDGVDDVWAGAGQLYFRRLSSRRTESHLSRVVSTPQYQLMTIRNWATTTAIAAMLDGG